MKNVVKRLSLLLLITAATGCTARYSKPTEPQFPSLQASPEIKPGEFPKEIAMLEAAIPKSTDMSFQRKARLRLAILYIDHKNPNPNYANALRELELYVSADQEGGKKAEIQNLLRLLRELSRQMDENRKGKVKMEQILQENRELKKTVEQLKGLDITIEEKRRQIK